MKLSHDAQVHPDVRLDEWIAHEVLQDPEQLAMSFMNAPNVGVGICDLEFRFRGINEALARMNGIPAKEHIGRTIYEVLGEFAAKVEPLFRQVVSSGNPLLNVHVTGKLPMQLEPGHWIENYFPLKDSKGSVRRLCSMVVEVTEQKRLEETLQVIARNRRDETEQLRLLTDFHSQLVRKPDPAELAGAITAFVNRRIPHDYAVLMLEDEATKWLSADPGREAKPTSRERVTASDLMYVHASAKVHGAVSHLEGVTPVFGQGVESLLTMQIATGRTKLGTLYLASRRKGAFDGVLREAVDQLAEQIAFALDYACTTREIESLKSKLTERPVEVTPPPERPGEFSEILGTSPAAIDRTLAAMERVHIINALRKAGGKISGTNGAAASLGVKRTTLQSKMHRLHIQQCEYKMTDSSFGGPIVK